MSTESKAFTEIDGRPLRLCILQSSYEGSNSPLSQHDVQCSPAFYYPGPTYETVPLKKATAVQQLVQLVNSGKYDIFFNLCDGSWDDDRAGEDVVRALERFGVAYTGANPPFYEPSKESMKMVCHYYGIPTAPFSFCFHLDDIKKAAAALRYPMIVKHFNGGNSIGMTANSRCQSYEQLESEALRFIREYGGALVEEFIDGPEYTVLVVENPDDPSSPVALAPVRVNFPAGESFKHFDLKWKEFEGMQWDEETDEDIVRRLKDAAVKMFLGCRGCSFGRCDIRMDSKTGQLYMLEINPNCSIFYPKGMWGSADFVMGFDRLGHVGVIDMMLRTAWNRYLARRKAYVVAYRVGQGYGMFAARDLEKGEIVVRHEDHPRNLVSIHRVRSEWCPLKRLWFAQHAFPVSANMYATWPEDPSAWLPMSHSCEPSACLEGMDVVCRHNIKKGDVISVDYATFCDETIESFDCKCGAAMCRGRVSGSDYLLPSVLDKYGVEHMSDALVSKITAMCRASEGPCSLPKAIRIHAPAIPSAQSCETVCASSPSEGHRRHPQHQSCRRNPANGCGGHDHSTPSSTRQGSNEFSNPGDLTPTSSSSPTALPPSTRLVGKHMFAPMDQDQNQAPPDEV